MVNRKGIFYIRDRKSLFLFKGQHQSRASFGGGENGCKLAVSGNLQHSLGPYIKPYIFAASQQERRREAGGHCAICEERFGVAESAQKKLRLTCSDHVHYECYRVVVECMAESIELYQALLDNMPCCKGPRCDLGGVRIQAESPGLTFRIFTNAQAMEKDSKNLSILGTTLKPKAPASTTTTTSTTSNTSTTSPTTTNTATNTFSTIPNDIERVPSPQIQEFDRLFELTSRISSHRSRSPSPSPTVATTNTLSLQITEYMLQDLDELRHKYIEHLLTSSQLSFATLCKLGTLRLVDNLLVSKCGEFALKSCYLFTNYLLVCEIDGTDCWHLPIDNGAEVSTTDESTFAISIYDSPTIWIQSEDPGVVEKWIVATSDPTATFPSQFLTSTFVLPEYQAQIQTPVSSPSTVNLDDSAKAESVFTNISALSEDESDSDVDSDQELINKFKTGKSLCSRLQNAVSEDTELLDLMLREMTMLKNTFEEFTSSFKYVSDQ